MNSKTTTLILLISGLLLGAMMTGNGDLAWMALPFLFYLGAGILLSPSLGRIRLEASRSVSRDHPDGTSGVDVRVTLYNQGLRIDQVYLYDEVQEGQKTIRGHTGLRAALRSGEETGLEYSIEEKRGSYVWQTVRAVVSDPLELIEIDLTLPASAEIQVQPEHSSFGRLPLKPRSTLHSPGSIPARLGGSGTDFWGVREYHPGDSLRWLDWRLTARHPGQFFTKEFEQEEIADIGLILDSRQKTDLVVGENSLFEHAVSAVSSLAEVFLQQGHRVSLLVYNGGSTTIFPGYGKVQLNKILRYLAKVKPGATELADHLEYLPLSMFSSQALLVVISPLAQRDWTFFPRLRANGFQGLLVSPNPFDYAARLFDARDTASRLAIRTARIERSLQLRNITQLHIPVIDWHVDQPLYPLVRSALSPVRGQRPFEGSQP